MKLSFSFANVTLNHNSIANKIYKRGVRVPLNIRNHFLRFRVRWRNFINFLKTRFLFFALFLLKYSYLNRRKLMILTLKSIQKPITLSEQLHSFKYRLRLHIACFGYSSFNLYQLQEGTSQ